jgi:hypothetical protein
MENSLVVLLLQECTSLYRRVMSPIVCGLVTNKDRNVPVYTAILYLLVFDIVVINLGNMTTKSVTSIVRYVIQVDLSDSQILKEYF